jgi:hypothetical protein
MLKLTTIIGLISAEIAGCCWDAVTWFFIIYVNFVLPLIKPLRSLVFNIKTYQPVLPLALCTIK